MLESVLFPGGVGFAWGLAVSLFSYFLTWFTLNHPKGIMSTLIFVVRQLLLIMAMAVVYRNLPMLIGTALGLLAVKNYIFIKSTIFRNRKG